MSTLPARTRRLIADRELLRQEFVDHSLISVEPMGGNPPERYRITYRVRGIERVELDGTPLFRDWHVAELYLHDSYPRQKPLGTLQTPIFHPNFGQFICIGDYWGASETLADVIVQIGQMIAYQKFNPASPLNRDAARWARGNVRLFPTDSRDMYPAQPRIEVSLGAASSAGAKESSVRGEMNSAEEPPPIQIRPGTKRRRGQNPADLDIRLS